MEHNKTEQGRSIATSLVGAIYGHFLAVTQHNNTVVMRRELADIERQLTEPAQGGLVPSSVVLLYGDPGIGKSTLLLQAATGMNVLGLRVLYVSGEESGAQIALRARRLGVATAGVKLLGEIQLQKIEAAIAAEAPDLVIIDSIQTMFSDELTAAPGSVSQVRECAAQLTRVAKAGGPAVILVGHVTKDGTMAGPRVLEHIVDAALEFSGDPGSAFRIVRAVKNRYGSSSELGVFSMGDTGLKEVSNPSAMFLSQFDRNVPGSSVLAVQEGIRTILLEVQALVDETQLPAPRRLAVGLDGQRLSMLLAVMSRHAGLALHGQDVFLNAVGGVKVQEPRDHHRRQRAQVLCVGAPRHPSHGRREEGRGSGRLRNPTWRVPTARRSGWAVRPALPSRR